ncbi:PREDICTED: uncharacterized protein LOC108562983 [Nicrophorus vespilloides]|uniref:Uncharacterized protein LOC108562983 n=1 Tax=Nicrophorus vespilloides TaxID=110193 RepID=A0ABM1MQZ0_NICVS|nr:PREDICTED: uncharacterized protein LOC108562983 [Nicrophorus vespilloides]
MLLKAVILIGALFACQGAYSQKQAIDLLNEISKPPILKALQPFPNRIKVYSPISIERGYELWMDRPTKDIQEDDDFVNEIMNVLGNDGYHNRDVYYKITDDCLKKNNETCVKHHVDNNNFTGKYPNNFLTIFNDNKINPDDIENNMNICIDHVNASNVSQMIVIELSKCVKTAVK